MKRILYILSFLAIIMILPSCAHKPNIEGAWQTVLKSNIPGQQKSTTVTYGFANDGKATANFVITTTEPVPSTDSIMAAYEVTTNATGQLIGTWEYVPNSNDISVTYDPESLTVNVDPEAVEYRSNLINGEQDPILEQLKPSMIKSAETQAASDIKKLGTQLLFKDVKVTDTSLKFKLDDEDYDLRKI